MEIDLGKIWFYGNKQENVSKKWNMTNVQTTPNTSSTDSFKPVSDEELTRIKKDFKNRIKKEEKIEYFCFITFCISLIVFALFLIRLVLFYWI